MIKSKIIKGLAMVLGFIIVFILVLALWNLIHDGVEIYTIVFMIAAFVLAFFPKQSKYYKGYSKRLFFCGVGYLIILLLESLRSFSMDRADIILAYVIFGLFEVVSIYFFVNIFFVGREMHRYHTQMYTKPRNKRPKNKKEIAKK
jgi:hypothetical protein